MTTISLCMIVKNEEEVLENCLKSVKKACDEIIIVDTGSTDETKEIAAKYTDKVIDFEWVDDFSAARNFSFSHAKMDYILWLDADDILKTKDLKKLLTLKKNLDPSVDAVSMFYHLAFDEHGNPTFNLRRNRLVKRERNFKWHGVVHEYLEVSGNIIGSDIAITHNKQKKKNTSIEGGRNLRIYEKKLKRGEPFTPRDLYYYANELKDNHHHKKATLYYKEFLATKKGWVEDEIMACINMADCYRRLGEKDEELNALCKSFQYDLPRPEISCRLGEYFMGKKDYQSAIFWFNTAINTKQKDNGGFQKPAYSTWFPHLHLVLCYWETGNMEMSYEHNKMAEKFIPNDPSVEFNNNFFKDYFKQEPNPTPNGKKKVLYIGWIGHKNLGDELMWNLFKEKFDESLGNENWELHGTIRKPARDFDLDQFDLIVLGGGSIICKNNTPVLHEAMKKGKKVMIWGSGIDLIEKSDIPLLAAGEKINVHNYLAEDIQKKLVEIIEHAEFAGVRGPLTYEIIRQVGANEEKLMISGDPGLLLTQKEKVDEEVKVAILPFKGNKIIGVNWGTSFNHVYGANERNVEDQLAEALKEYINNGYKIYLYSVWDHDTTALKQLYKKVNDHKNVILDTKLHDQNFLIDLASHFHFTINLKLHANLISLAANTPPIALAYGFKVYDFAKSTQLDQFVIPTDSMQMKSELMEMEALINQERDKIINRVNEIKAEYINHISSPFNQHLYLRRDDHA
ncbi:beta 1,4 glucosyltransferase [Pontibacillus marinus BH030004 = DSM 16465]|uniref:Beta 1,4 glucosyltransferase n=1 Tax=Pontibacillus marinus BH030004 = DSM 16465 TaxID=1385511 RepID=A0A0A5GB56_9BACI|nr:beta 1,4 glucosyltransferase [Pontibacillus marinus BH030004 = DSM 16465]